MMAIMGIQYVLFLGDVIPSDIKKLTTLHMFILILTQASIFLAVASSLQIKLKLPFLGQGDEIKMRDLFFGFVGLMLVNVLNSIYLTLMGMAPDQFKEFSSDILTGNVYLFMLTVAFIGPIYEEVIFRGYMLGMLVLKHTGKSEPVSADASSSLSADVTTSLKLDKAKILPILFTSFLFMFAHFDEISKNLLVGLPWLLLGLYFAVWAIYKKGIMLTIILHITQNLMASLAMLYQSQHM